MPSRLYTFFVLTAWLASMGWLFAAKIWPTLYGGDPPDYSASVVQERLEASPTIWRITWKDRRIGMAASQSVRHGEGIAQRYVVQFERLPLEMMLSEAFGVLGAWLFPGRQGRDGLSQENTGHTGDGPTREPERRGSWELDMLLATQLHFDRRREFTSFHTIGDVAGMPGLFRLRGTVTEGRKLELLTHIAAPAGADGKALRHELHLPANAIVNDAFAPRPELQNLRVGQKWTIPVYRPFPPNSPVQIVAAHAERHELVLWDGRDVETILVVYHDDAGAGLSATQEPVAREWVRRDGLVLQQEVRWSGTTIRFEREPDITREPVADWLDEELHPRLWRPHD